MEKQSIRLLQLPAFRLDSRLPIRGLRLEPAQAQQLSVIGLQALKAAFSICREANISAVLIPGDLVDASTVTSAILSELLEIFSSVPLPIFITPGAFDPYGPESIYLPEVLASRCGRDWPGNVHIFGGNALKEVILPNNPTVSIAAIARQNPGQQVSLRALAPRSQAAMRILAMSLCADDIAGAVLPELSADNERLAVPASELRSLGYSYAALGGLPNCRYINTAEGELLGCYAGTATGMIPAENGPRYALISHLSWEASSSGGITVNIDKLELPVPQVKLISLEYTAGNTEPLLSQIEKSLKMSGARPGLDLVYIRVLGSCLPEDSGFQLPENMSRSFPCFIVADQRRLQNQDDVTSAESRLISLLKTVRHNCQAASAGVLDDSRYPSPISTSVVDEALLYGLEALRAGKVTVKNVD